MCHFSFHVCHFSSHVCHFWVVVCHFSCVVIFAPCVVIFLLSASNALLDPTSSIVRPTVRTRFYGIQRRRKCGFSAAEHKTNPTALSPLHSTMATAYRMVQVRAQALRLRGRFLVKVQFKRSFATKGFFKLFRIDWCLWISTIRQCVSCKRHNCLMESSCFIQHFDNHHKT